MRLAVSSTIHTKMVSVVSFVSMFPEFLGLGNIGVPRDYVTLNYSIR